MACQCISRINNEGRVRRPARIVAAAWVTNVRGVDGERVELNWRRPNGGATHEKNPDDWVKFCPFCRVAYDEPTAAAQFFGQGKKEG